MAVPLAFAADYARSGFWPPAEDLLHDARSWLGLSGDHFGWTFGATRGEMRRPLFWFAMASEPGPGTTFAHGVSIFFATQTACLFLLAAAVALNRRLLASPGAGVIRTDVRAFLAAMALAFAWVRHPVNAAAVACVAQQGTILGGLLVVGSALLWWLALTKPDGARRFAFPLALLALALLADPTLCLAPAALVALTLYVRRDEPSPLGGVRRPLVVASVIGALAFVTSYAVREPGGGAPLGPSLFATATQVVRPLRSLLWPVGLHPGYDPPSSWPTEIAPPLYVDAVTAVALIVAGVWGLSRRNGLGCALLAYLACVAGRALLGRDVVGADGDAYVATIPIFVAAGVLVARFVARGGRARAVIGLGGAFGAFAVFAWLYVVEEHAWRKPDTFTARVLAVDPTNERALVARGDEARKRGAPLEEASSWYRRALEPSDWRPLAHARVGGALLESGDAVGARDHLERAVAIAPWLAAARFDLGALELREGRLDEAKSQLAAAARLEPESADAWRLLAQARDKSGDVVGALDALTRAAALHPDDGRIAEELRRLRR
jgi:hypothetical protein